MSVKRMIDSDFWSDSYVRKIKREESHLFLYLLTNVHTKLIGIYELPIDTICFEAKFEEKEVRAIIKRFQRDGKIFYVDGYIFIVNFLKYQNLKSPKIKSAINMAIEGIPESVLAKISDILGMSLKENIRYRYGIEITDTVLL